jgi:type II secretory pathway component PulF
MPAADGVQYNFYLIMANTKSQEMSIQTVVILILVLVVLVVILAFVVPQLTTLFSGLSGLGEDVTGQLPEIGPLTPKD